MPEMVGPGVEKGARRRGERNERVTSGCQREAWMRARRGSGENRGRCSESRDPIRCATCASLRDGRAGTRDEDSVCGMS